MCDFDDMKNVRECKNTLYGMDFVVLIWSFGGKGLVVWRNGLEFVSWILRGNNRVAAAAIYFMYNKRLMPFVQKDRTVMNTT